MDKESYIVGLSGGSASGKTTFIKALQQQFKNDELCVISLDHYYKPLSAQKRDKAGFVNFDHPDGIDFRRIKRDIAQLLIGKEVRIVEYTFNNPGIFPREITFRPSPIILLEGLYVFSDSWLMKKMKWRLYLEVELSVAYQRRLSRDMTERGMKEAQVHYQWQNHVLPSHEEHLRPYLKDVHLMINNNENFLEGLGLVTKHFKEVLGKDEI